MRVLLLVALVLFATAGVVAAGSIGEDAAEHLLEGVRGASGSAHPAPSFRLFGVTMQPHVIAPHPQEAPSSVAPHLEAARGVPHLPPEPALAGPEAPHSQPNEVDFMKRRRKLLDASKHQLKHAQKQLSRGDEDITEQRVQDLAQKHQELVKSAVVQRFHQSAGGVPPMGFVHPKGYSSIAKAMRRQGLPPSLYPPESLPTASAAGEHLSASSSRSPPRASHDQAEPSTKVVPERQSLEEQDAHLRKTMKKASRKLWRDTKRLRESGAPQEEIRKLQLRHQELKRDVSFKRFKLRNMGGAWRGVEPHQEAAESIAQAMKHDARSPEGSNSHEAALA